MQKKKKGLIIGLVVGTLVLVGGGATAGVLLTASNKDEKVSTTNPGGENNNPTEPTNPQVETEEQRLDKVFSANNKNQALDTNGQAVGIDSTKFNELQKLDVNNPKYEQYYAQTMNIPKKYAKSAISALRRDSENKPVLTKRASGLIHNMGGGNEPTVDLAKKWVDSKMLGFADTDNTTDADSTLPFVSEVASVNRLENTLKLAEMGYDYTSIKNEDRVKKTIYDNSFATKLWNTRSNGGTDKTQVSMLQGSYSPIDPKNNGVYAIPMGNHISSYFLKGETNITLNFKARFIGNLMVKTSLNGVWERVASGDGDKIVEFKRKFATLFAVRIIITPDTMDITHKNGWGEITEEGLTTKNIDRFTFDFYDLFFQKTVGNVEKVQKARKVNSFAVSFNRFWMEDTDIKWLVYGGEIDNLKEYMKADFETLGFKGYTIDTKASTLKLKESLIFSTSFLKRGYGVGIDYYLTFGGPAFNIKKPYKVLMNNNNPELQKRINDPSTPIIWFSEELNKEYITPKLDENGVQETKTTTVTDDEGVTSTESTPINREGDYRLKPKFNTLSGVGIHELYHATADNFIYSLSSEIKWFDSIASWLNDLNPLNLTTQKQKDDAYFAIAKYFSKWMFHSYQNYPTLWTSLRLGNSNRYQDFGDDLIAKTLSWITTDNSDKVEKTKDDGTKELVSSEITDKLYKRYWKLVKELSGDDWDGARYIKESQTQRTGGSWRSGKSSILEEQHLLKTYLLQYMIKNDDKTLAEKLNAWIKLVVEDNELSSDQKVTLIQYMSPGTSGITSNQFFNTMGMSLADISSIDGSPLTSETNQKEGTLSKLASKSREYMEGFIKIDQNLIGNRTVLINKEIAKLEAKVTKTAEDIARIADLKYIVENNWTKLPDGTEFDNSYSWGFDLWRKNLADRPAHHPWYKFQDSTNPSYRKVMRSYRDSRTDDGKAIDQELMKKILPDDLKNDIGAVRNYNALSPSAVGDPFWGIAGKENLVWQLRKYTERFFSRQDSSIKKYSSRVYGETDRDGNTRVGGNKVNSLTSETNPQTKSQYFTQRDTVKLLLSTFLDKDLGVDPEFDNITEAEQDAKLWNIMQKLMLVQMHAGSKTQSVESKPTFGYETENTKYGDYTRREIFVTNPKIDTKQPYHLEEHENKLNDGKSLIPEKERVSKTVSITNDKFNTGNEWETKRPNIVVVKFTTKDGREVEEYVQMGFETRIGERKYDTEVMNGNSPVSGYAIEKTKSYTKPLKGVNNIYYANLRKYGIKRRGYYVAGTKNNDIYTINSPYTLNNLGKAPAQWISSSSTDAETDSWQYSIYVEAINGIGGTRNYKVTILEDTIVRPSETIYNSKTISNILSIRLLTADEITKGRKITGYDTSVTNLNNIYIENYVKTGNDLPYHENIVGVRAWRDDGSSPVPKQITWWTTHLENIIKPDGIMSDLPKWYTY